MIRFFNRYQKSFLGIFIGGLICISMLGFGIGMGGGSQDDRYALKVNEELISHEEFNRQRRQVQDRYRMILGEQYSRMAPFLMKNLNQDLIDSFISSTLLEQEAKRLELHVGEEEVKRTILTQLFPQGFSAEKYKAFLSSIGQSSQSFEAGLAADALRNQFRALLTDVSEASDTEALALLKAELTKYDVNYLSFAPADLLSEVPEPKEEELNKYYEENLTDFELSPRAAYSYVAFNPEDGIELVQLQDEDVEFYYTENIRRFTEPEKLKLRHIQLNYPEESDPAKMAKVRELAKEIYAKAQAGDDFATLARDYSDDIATKVNGGDMGWITRGKLEKPFESAVFKLKEPGLAELIEVDYGFHVALVEDYQAPAPKELEEVKDTIEKELRLREAPAFMSAKAGDLYDAWLAKNSSLADFAKEKELKVETSDGLLEQRNDPPMLMGLTAKVLENPEMTRQLIELANRTVLVEITDFKDTTVPPLAEIKDKVLEAFKAKESQKIALNKAQALSSELADKKFASLKELAEQEKFELKEKKELQLDKVSEPLFSDKEVKSFIRTANAGDVASRYFKIGGKYYLVELSKIIEPEEKLLNEKLADYREKASEKVADILITSIINKLKDKAQIDVDQGLLVQ